MNDQNRTAPTQEQKRVYQTPRLSSYGDFNTMTLGNAGPKGDGGPALSKA